MGRRSARLQPAAASPDAAVEPPSAVQAASDLLVVVRTLETPALADREERPNGSPDFDDDPQATGNAKPGSARGSKRRKRVRGKQPGNTPGVQSCACNAPWCLPARRRATNQRRVNIPTGSKDEAKERRAAWLEYMPHLPADCGDKGCMCTPVRYPQGPPQAPSPTGLVV